MEAVFFGMIIASIATALYVAIGTSLREVRLHKIARQFARHPHARVWRKRPHIVAILEHGSKVSAKDSGYRKLRVAENNERLPEDYFVHIAPATRIDKSALMQAVHTVNSAKVQSAILLPALDTPSSYSQLLGHYHMMLSALLVSAAAGYGVSTNSPYHMISNRAAPTFPRWLSFILQSIHLFVIVYSLSAAIVLQRPELLVLYLAGLLLWSIWSIGSYPFLSFGRKIYYAALLPAAIPFLLLHVIVAPFRLLVASLPHRFIQLYK